MLAADPVTGAGIASQLRFRRDLLVQPVALHGADVVVVVGDDVDDQAVQQIRAASRNGSRVVVVASRLSGTAVLAAVDAGATAVLRRGDATVDQLAEAVRGAAHGDGVISPDLLGRMLATVGTVSVVRRPGGVGARQMAGLTHRELQVLRLIADGATTREVARELCYSERTIKNILQALTERLQLRNRTHAVAYALRHGLV